MNQFDYMRLHQWMSFFKRLSAGGNCSILQKQQQLLSSLFSPLPLGTYCLATTVCPHHYL